MNMHSELAPPVLVADFNTLSIDEAKQGIQQLAKSDAKSHSQLPDPNTSSPPQVKPTSALSEAGSQSMEIPFEDKFPDSNITKVYTPLATATKFKSQVAPSGNLMSPLNPAQDIEATPSPDQISKKSCLNARIIKNEGHFAVDLGA